MNIALISMDCVRPDYLNTPFFHKIRSEGLEFTNCIAQAPHTSTSHVSLLTGLYPFNHGVRWLVNFEVKGKMLQERLKENGYETAAFIGGFPLTTGDLNRGFDLFEHGETVNDEMEGRSVFDPANVLTLKAVEWLNNRKHQDNFIFLHFFDAHLTLRSEFVHDKPEKDEHGVYKNIEKYIGRRKRRYREEVDFMSSQLKLLTELCDLDLLVVTSDHGEKMQGEKNYPWVHNLRGKKISSHFHEVELWDVQLKVPLLFWGQEVENECIEEQVRSIDITPTILDFADIPQPPVDGTTLLHQDYPQYAYSETYFAQLVKENIHAREMDEKHDWGWHDIPPLVCMRTNKYKLICTAQGEIVPVMLFNLEVDPREEENLLGQVPVQTDLKNELMEILKDDEQWKKGKVDS